MQPSKRRNAQCKMQVLLMQVQKALIETFFVCCSYTLFFRKCLKGALNESEWLKRSVMLNSLRVTFSGYCSIALPLSHTFVLLRVWISKNMSALKCNDNATLWQSAMTMCCCCHFINAECSHDRTWHREKSSLVQTVIHLVTSSFGLLMTI